MAVRINNNIPALNSLRYLGASTDRLSVSIERLSSGMRINRSSDDPAGLAISEKLRAQVSGVQRASLNAQDGISMLQVAEGALSEVQAVLQRVREISVQAANGAYTQNDRLEMQREVDQLLQEVNRVANDTEFNTKRLLSGAGTGLWSADHQDIQAILRNPPREGNYIIQKQNTPGLAQVLKSGIFSLSGATRGLAQDIVQNIITVPGDPPLSRADFTGFQDLEFTRQELGGPSNANQDFQLQVLPAAAAGDQVALVDHVHMSGSGKSGFALAGGALLAGQSGYYELEVSNVEGGTTLDGSASGVAVVARRFDAKGDTIDSRTVTSTKAAVAAGGIAWFAGLTGGLASTVQLGQVGDQLQAGDKWLFAVNAQADLAPGTDVMQFRQDLGDDGLWTADTTGAGAVSNTPEDRFSLYTQMGTTLSGGTSFPTSLAYYDSADRAQFATGNLRLGLNGTTPAVGSAQFDLFETSVAERTTQLRDLDQMQAGAGATYVDGGQTLHLYANGKQADVVIQGSDTLEQLAAKLRDAIVNPAQSGGLGMSVDGNLRRYALAGGVLPAGVDGNTAVFVDDPLAGSDEAIEGTMVIRSTVPDTEGRITFSGDERILQALALATVQEPTDSLLAVTILDAHTGIAIGSQAVSDGTVRGVIPGVDLLIDPRVDTSIQFDPTRRSLQIASAAGMAVERLHIVDTSFRFQTGANEGQILRANVGQMDSQALGLNDLLVVSSQYASEAIAKADGAIALVSSERAKLGAFLTRLGTTRNILDVQSENLQSSESRIRDLDVAAQTIDFTRDQILQQAGTALLAQANALPQSVLQLLR